MIVVARTIEVRRHRRMKKNAVLLTVVLAKLQAGDFRDGIRLVRRLKRARQKRVLPHRLGSVLGINTGTAEKQEPLRAVAIGGVDRIGGNLEIFVNELSGIRFVGVNPPYPCRGHDHQFRLLLVKKTLHGSLRSQVEFGVSPHHETLATSGLETFDESRPDHPAVARDVDRARAHGCSGAFVARYSLKPASC